MNSHQWCMCNHYQLFKDCNTPYRPSVLQMRAESASQFDLVMAAISRNRVSRHGFQGIRRVYVLTYLFLLGYLVGCRHGGTSEAIAPPERASCFRASSAMETSAILQSLSRSAREARANSLVRVNGIKEPIFATLHAPRLALLEAALASPKEAQESTPSWLNSHLTQGFIELQTQMALDPDKATSALEKESVQSIDDLEGEMWSYFLMDGKGVKQPIVLTLKRQVQGGWLYRILLDPRSLLDEQERYQLVLFMAKGKIKAEARWRLHGETERALDALPWMAGYERQRELRLARWALLLGDLDEAKARNQRVLSCSPGFEPARHLQEHLYRVAHAPSPQKKIQPFAVEKKKRAQQLSRLKSDPIPLLALRVALFNHLVPLFNVGFLKPSIGKRVEAALNKAFSTLKKERIEWLFPYAILEIDRLLSTVLIGGLSGQSAPEPPAKPLKQLDWLKSKWPRKEDLLHDLEQRLVLANYQFFPQWVKGVNRSTAPVPEKLIPISLQEVTPFLMGVYQQFHVHVLLNQRLGWGWLHPGLPTAHYKVRFLDRQNGYWKTRAEVSRTSTEIKKLAREVLEREIYSPDEKVAALALKGFVRLRGQGAYKSLLSIAQKQPGFRGACALIQLAKLKGKAVDEAILKASRSTNVDFRRGAMLALGDRSVPRRLELLQAGLKDRDLQVAKAALESLLRLDQTQGLKTAKSWLKGSNHNKRKAVIILASSFKEPFQPLKNELVGAARTISPTIEDIRDVEELLGNNATALFKIWYKKNPSLRETILSIASAEAFKDVLQMALESDSNAIKLIALRKLSSLSHPPQKILMKFITNAHRSLRLAAHLGLAKLGRPDSLLALGDGARGSCEERQLVVPELIKRMDTDSRRLLLLDSMQSSCPELWVNTWQSIEKWYEKDLTLIKAALAHGNRRIRVLGAMSALGVSDK